MVYIHKDMLNWKVFSVKWQKSAQPKNILIITVLTRRNTQLSQDGAKPKICKTCCEANTSSLNSVPSPSPILVPHAQKPEKWLRRDSLRQKRTKS